MWSDLIFYSQSKWAIFWHHSCILIYYSRFHTLSTLQYYGRKTIAHAFWFTTVTSKHYHLVNNIEEKYCSCILIYYKHFIHYHLSHIFTSSIIQKRHRSSILIYHSNFNKLSPFTHYYFLNNTEKNTAHVYLFNEKKVPS